ncbi:MAG TPA: hypothetical protein VNE62_06665 [Actinomycetota bacterium]|nr:hypothetical protein [Actinomycetota bacterium]
MGRAGLEWRRAVLKAVVDQVVVVKPGGAGVLPESVEIPWSAYIAGSPRGPQLLRARTVCDRDSEFRSQPALVLPGITSRTSLS